MYKKLILAIVGLFIFNSTMLGQAQKNTYLATEIKLNAGVVFTDFVNGQPLPLRLCWGACYSIIQTTKPSLSFGGQINFDIKSRHRLGFSYQWQQIRVAQEIMSSFGKDAFIYKENFDFHGFYLQHQFQTVVTEEERWWTNAIGIDMSLYRKDLKEWPLFYRTSFSIPLKIADIRGISIEPFFQISIVNYNNRIITEQSVRPFMLGFLLQYAFSRKKE